MPARDSEDVLDRAADLRAVILLDGARMLQAPELRIGESCLRWWSNAAALAAPGAPIHLVGVNGPVARALATWTPAAYARSELESRRPLQMPPTTRVAQIDGLQPLMAANLEDLMSVEGIGEQRARMLREHGQGHGATHRSDAADGSMSAHLIDAASVFAPERRAA